jgi:two-component system, sensor histidine kinase and response regulator
MTRILVIEDEEALRLNLQALLEAEDYQSLGAANGRSGVELAREHLPDLILCDVMMPELDGYGVLAELHQDPVTATIPFIFLTAKADKLALRQGMELGADDYLTKPFTIDEVLKAVTTRLEKRASVDKKYRQKLEDLRGSITFLLPHELRTPLTGILNGSEMLKEMWDELGQDDKLRMVDIVHHSAQRLQRLILNYLLYAELELAAAAPPAAPVLPAPGMNLHALVTAVATQKAHPAQREADLSFDLAEATLLISEDHLRKIVEELLDNAFKFSRAGTAVRVTGTRTDQAYTLAFVDHGIGLTVKQIADIGAYMQFERKLHEQQGSGLGLTIARRLVELYGGKLSIESIPGLQTTVSVTLPMG